MRMSQDGSIDGLSPQAQKALLKVFCVRRLESLPEEIFTDLFLVEAADLKVVSKAWKVAKVGCGARIPVAVVTSEPATLLMRVEDLGVMAAWYFRAVECLIKHS